MTEIRRLNAEDMPQLARMKTVVYNGRRDFSKEEKIAPNPLAHPSEWSWGAFQGGKLYSGMTENRYLMRFDGHSVPMSGIGGVETLPEARKVRGFLAAGYFIMKKFLFVLFFIVCNNFLHAFDNTRFFWSLGDIGINFENTENNIKIFPSLNAGTISWITNFGLGWGFHVFSIESGTDWTQALIFPVELSYSPFGDNSKRLFLTLYGRGGWALNYGPDISGTLFDRSDFFGAAGLRAAWIPELGEHWSVFTGAFIEYTSKNEIRMGISLDTSVIIVLTAIVLGISLSDDEDEY